LFGTENIGFCAQMKSFFSSIAELRCKNDKIWVQNVVFAGKRESLNQFNNKTNKTTIETNQMFQIDIIEQCKANNRKAQLKLYKQYCDSMFCIAMRFLKNADDAEDVLQEAFIKAFQKIHQFNGEVTFGAWLKRIVINKSIDFLKSKKQKLVELDESYMHIETDEDWTIEESITLDEVKTAIEQLPEKYKYVVLMFLMEGYDHSEISQVLQLPETTCRTRLLRGKGLLKELLKCKNYGTGS